jgi:multidrug efflux system membrane fusion protein
MVVCALGAWAVWRALSPNSDRTSQTIAPTLPGVVPVTAGTAVARDVPVYLDGIGAVQAYNTVTVKVRVDGQLQQVAFREGQDVRKGDLLAQIDPRPLQAALAQAQAAKLRDESQLANAKLDLQRYTDLSQKGYATRQALDTQAAQVQSYAAAVQSDQAAIDNAQTQLSYATIRAPIDGRTGLRLVDEGNMVHATDQTGLVIIAQLHPIAVIFTLPETNLPAINQRISAGQLKVEAYSRDGAARLADGVLELVDNQIDQTTGTIKLKASFPNEDNALWPGQFVNARLLIRTEPNGVTVPAQVVQRGPQGTFAYVIKADQTVEIRPITIAQIDQGSALISSGLAAGEQVVVDGQYRLQNGTKVAPQLAEQRVEAAPKATP